MYPVDDIAKFVIAYEKILDRKNVNGMEIIVIAVQWCSKFFFLQSHKLVTVF